MAEDGRTLIEASLFVLMHKAVMQLGPGKFMFTIGARAVGHWL